MLMHAHDRTVDHLHLAIVRLDDGIHQPVPDACLAPAIEAIVGGRIRPVRSGKSRHGAPARSTQKMPVRTLRLPFDFVPRLSIGSSGSIMLHSKSVQIVSHDAGSDVSKL